MAIKAIALDIDGTLTNDEKVVTARTREALLAAQRSGVRLILSSGRPVQGLRTIASELGLEAHGGLLVSFNGAHVVDAGTDEVLYDQPIEVDVMRSLVEHDPRVRASPCGSPFSRFERLSRSVTVCCGGVLCLWKTSI